MIKVRMWSLYLFGFPADLVGVLFALVLAPFQQGLGLRLERKPRSPGLRALTLDVRWLPGEYAAIAIAPHVIFYRTGMHYGQGWSVLQDYEHAQCKEYEGASMMASLMALVAFVFGAPWLAVLPMWSVAPWLYVLAGYVVARLRGEAPYRGPCNEESAYALSADHSNR